MLNIQKCFNDLLPVAVTATGREIQQFLDKASRRCAGSTEFVQASNIWQAASCAEAMLVSVGLKREFHVGAVLTHCERGGSAYDIIRPAASFQLRRSPNYWVLEKVSTGLMFPFEPVATGIRLTYRQRAQFLWIHAQSLQTIESTV